MSSPLDSEANVVRLPGGIEPRPTPSPRNDLRLVTAVLLGIMLLIAGFALGLMSLMRGRDVYVGALARVKASPDAAAVLGSPIHDGYFLRGHIKTGPTAGRAKLLVALSGPKGSGRLEIVATKSGGEWHYSHLGLNVDGRQIELAGPDR